MKIVTINLSAPAALKRVRDIAKDSEKIFILSHAKKRQNERHITRSQIIACLRKGQITEGPCRELSTGNWRIRMEYFISGQNIAVIAELLTNDNNEKILVITAFFRS